MNNKGENDLKGQVTDKTVILGGDLNPKRDEEPKELEDVKETDVIEELNKTKNRGKLNIPTEDITEANSKSKKQKKSKRDLSKDALIGHEEKKSKSKKGKVLAFFKWFIIIVLTLGILMGGYIFTQVKPLLKESKKVAYDKLTSIGTNTFRLMENTKIYDNKGELIKEIKANNYHYTPINQVSKYIRDGYIAVEDRNFLNHKGIDFVALTRAGLALVKNDGKITQGGSTITQQVIKNMLLTQERTFNRKLIEFFLAPDIEKKYSKADIMEFYVNTNYYGNGCYGVASASKYYFGKAPSKLTLGESALLVGLSNNPSKYNPVKNQQNAINKRNSVLSKMLEVEMITEKEYENAKKEELNLVLEKKLSDGKEDYMTSYAIHSTTLKAMELDGFEFKYAITDEEEYKKYQEEYSQAYSEMSSLVRSGGYNVYTSLDRGKQELLQKSVDSKLSKFTEKDELTGKYTMQGAGVIVNNETGLIEAIVGGRGTEDNFNRGFLGIRQPGSTIKPIVDYGPAFDTGDYYPSYVMEDKHIPKGPRNAYSGYKGDKTLRDAIAMSINTIPYRILLDISPKVGLEYLGKMRFDTLTPSDNVGSLALGGITKGVRIVDMAKAYSTIANEGVFIDNTCITKLEYGNDGVVYDGEAKKSRVYTQDTAYMLVDILKGVLDSNIGTGRKFKLDNAIAFAKTGTTSNNKDSYFCGSTTDYTLAVWAGYDMPKKIDSIGEGYTGQIWKEVMDALHKNQEPRDFNKPSTIITANVNSSGHMTSNKTGKSDIFSQVELEKEQIKKEEKERKQLVEVERQWQEEDKNRQRSVERLLADYEGMSIQSTDDLTVVDKKYRELTTAINMISDKAKKESYNSRLGIKKGVLDRERTPWEDLLREEENKRLIALQEKMEKEELAKANGKNKAKAKLLSDAESSLDSLKVLNSSDSKKYYYVAQAEDAISRCYGYTEYSSLLDRLSSEKSRLMIGSMNIETPRPSPPVNNGNEGSTNTDNSNNSSNSSNNSNNSTDNAQE